MNDRRRGALIGLAVGDALGAAVEFKSPGSFAPVTGYRSGGPHRLETWRVDRRHQHGAGPGRQHRHGRLGLERSSRPICSMVEDRQVFGERAMFRHRHHHQKCALAISPRTRMHSHPATAPKGPAAMARSCGWLRFRSDSGIFTPIGWTSFPGSPRNRACRRTPANNAFPPAGIWRLCWLH